MFFRGLDGVLFGCLSGRSFGDVVRVVRREVRRARGVGSAVAIFFKLRCSLTFCFVETTL